MDKVIKPKTARGKRILAKRAPQVNEGPKNCVFIKGTSSNLITNVVMKDICLLKKPHSVFLNRKNDIKPFEDASEIELLAKKSESSLFMFGSHSKKRPNNIVIGRTFDSNIMDMFEFGVENFKPMSDFKNSKISLGSKPLLVFSGQQFEEEDDYKRLKNFLIDFFVGSQLEGLRLSGVEHLIQIVAHESKVYFRCYKVLLKNTGTKYGKVELEEMGPRMDLTLRRVKLASEDLLKKALKKPIETKVKKIKNVKRSGLGSTLGRIHMTRQDYSQLQTRKMKGLKKSNSAPQSDTNMTDVEETQEETKVINKAMKELEINNESESPSKLKGIKRPMKVMEVSKKVRFSGA